VPGETKRMTRFFWYPVLIVTQRGSRALNLHARVVVNAYVLGKYLLVLFVSPRSFLSVYPLLLFIFPPTIYKCTYQSVVPSSLNLCSRRRIYTHVVFLCVPLYGRLV
jgi:hypothetical protein